MKLRFLPVHVMTTKSLEKIKAAAFEEGKREEMTMTKGMMANLAHQNARMRIKLMGLN